MKRKSLGTAREIAARAESFYQSAANNWTRIRKRHGRVNECSNIEHYTNVVTEASVAAVLAEHAGDTALERQADRLTSRATHAQRGAIKACSLGIRR